MYMKLSKLFMVITMLASTYFVYGQRYKLYSAYLPVEYKSDGKWCKVRRDVTKLTPNSFVRCKSDFTIQEIGGTERLHFCSSSESGEQLMEVMDKNAIKKTQTKVTTWFKSGSAYEIAEADSPTIRDTLADSPYNLHYLMVDVHNFDDTSWGNLGLPNVDLDTLEFSIREKMLQDNHYNLISHKILYSPNNTTTDSIRWHFDNLASQINEDQKNLVILYLSSHGARSKSNEFCFITTDSKYDFFDRGKLTNFISGTEINNYVRQMVMKRAIVLVFVDACYSGTLISDLDKDDKLKDGNVAYFVSTGGDLKAFQDSNGSPFAEALNKALSSREQWFFRENNNIVSPYYLELYIQQTVNSKHKGQKPVSMRGKGLDPEFKLWTIQPKITRDLIEDLHELVKNGNTDAMVELGDIFFKGNEEHHINQDFSKAYNYYNVAFTKRNIKATAKVGLCYYYGLGVDKNYDKAFEYFSWGAMDKDDLAKYYLGVCYAKGLGTKVNKKKSKKTLSEIVKWHDNDIISAMVKEKVNIPGVEILYNDGFLSHAFGFDVGEMVPIKIVSNVSDGTSVSDIEFEASMGKVKAQAAIGKIYLYGLRDQNVDYNRAVTWLKKAEAAGSASALADLGYCYANGYGVKKDERKAWEYFQESANKGYSPAYVIMGNYYFFGSNTIEQNDRDAAENWQIAANKGNEVGLYKLGLCYKYGIGVKQDEKESLRWLTKSAKKSYSLAQYELGNYYFYRKEYQNAYKWLNKAKKAGNKMAKRMIDQHFYLDGKVREYEESEN